MKMNIELECERKIDREIEIACGHKDRKVDRKNGQILGIPFLYDISAH